MRKIYNKIDWHGVITFIFLGGFVFYVLFDIFMKLFIDASY